MPRPADAEAGSTMSDPLAWTGAIGGTVAAAGAVIAAIGAWRTEATARWQDTS